MVGIADYYQQYGGGTPMTGSTRFDQVLLVARCWSCEAARYRRVARRNQHHAYLVWFCAACDVSWSGPGDPVVPSTAGR